IAGGWIPGSGPARVVFIPVAARSVCYNPRMALIVGVHGIGQQFGGGYQLGSVWYDALRDGLSAAGYRLFAVAQDVHDGDTQGGDGGGEEPRRAGCPAGFWWTGWRRGGQSVAAAAS